MFIKASNPLSLNQNNFVIYIAILHQFADFMRRQSSPISENNYVEINVRSILQSLGKHDSGRSYERFMNTVRKLAYTTVEYDRLININGLKCKKVGNPLMYEYRYSKSISIDTNYLHKKLFIKMHPSIVDICISTKSFFYDLDS